MSENLNNAQLRVKPLEWERLHGSDVSGYAFYSYHPSINMLFRGPTDDETVGRYETLEEAKAAAQADYEARILSALSPIEPIPAPPHEA